MPCVSLPWSAAPTVRAHVLLLILLQTLQLACAAGNSMAAIIQPVRLDGRICRSSLVKSTASKASGQQNTTSYDDVPSARACHRLCMEAGPDCVAFSFGYDQRVADSQNQCLLCSTQETLEHDCCFTTYPMLRVAQILESRPKIQASLSAAPQPRMNTMMHPRIGAGASRRKLQSVSNTTPPEWCDDSPVLLGTAPADRVYSTELTGFKFIFSDAINLRSDGEVSAWVSPGMYSQGDQYSLSMWELWSISSFQHSSVRKLEVDPGWQGTPQTNDIMYLFDLDVGVVESGCEIYADFASCLEVGASYNNNGAAVEELNAVSWFDCQRQAARIYRDGSLFNGAVSPYFTFDSSNSICSVFDSLATTPVATTSEFLSGMVNCVGLASTFTPNNHMFNLGLTPANPYGQKVPAFQEQLNFTDSFEFAFDMSLASVSENLTTIAVLKVSSIPDGEHDAEFFYYYSLLQEFADTTFDSMQFAISPQTTELYVAVGEQSCFVPSSFQLALNTNVKVRTRYSDGLLRVTMRGNFGAGEVVVQACTFNVDLSDWEGKEVELWLEFPGGGLSGVHPIDGSVGNIVFITKNLGADPFAMAGTNAPPALTAAYITNLDVRSYSRHDELLGVPVYEHCGTWSSVMSDAQEVCDATPGCTVILSPGYPGAGLCDEEARWYVCTSTISELLAVVVTDLSSGYSCTMVAAASTTDFTNSSGPFVNLVYDDDVTSSAAAGQVAVETTRASSLAPVLELFEIHETGVMYLEFSSDVYFELFGSPYTTFAGWPSGFVNGAGFSESRFYGLYQQGNFILYFLMDVGGGQALNTNSSIQINLTGPSIIGSGDESWPRLLSQVGNLPFADMLDTTMANTTVKHSLSTPPRAVATSWDNTLCFPLGSAEADQVLIYLNSFASERNYEVPAKIYLCSTGVCPDDLDASDDAVELATLDPSSINYGSAPPRLIVNFDNTQIQLQAGRRYAFEIGEGFLGYGVKTTTPLSSPTSSTSTSSLSSTTSSTSKTSPSTITTTSRSSSSSGTSITSTTSSSSTSTSNTLTTSSTSSSTSNTLTTSSSSSSTSNTLTTSSSSSSSSSSTSTTSSSSSSTSSSPTTLSSLTTITTSSSTSTTNTWTTSSTSSSTSMTSSSTSRTSSSTSRTSSSTSNTWTTSSTSTSRTTPLPARRLAKSKLSLAPRRLSQVAFDRDSEAVRVELQVCGNVSVNASGSSIASVWAGPYSGMVGPNNVTAVLEADAVRSVFVDGERNSVASEADSIRIIGPNPGAFYAYPSTENSSLSNENPTFMITFDLPVAFVDVGGVMLGDLELNASDIIVQGRNVFIIPPEPLPASFCIALPSTAFVNRATGRAFHPESYPSSQCFTLDEGEPTTTTTTTTTTTPTMCDSSLSTAGPIEWTTNCSGMVAVDTVCVAVSCPSGGLSVGSMECFHSGYMIGVTYCLDANTLVGSIETVVGELLYSISSTSSVTNTTLFDALKLAMLQTLGVTDETQVMQFLAQTLNVSIGGVRRLDEDKPLRRELQSSVVYDVSVFYEVYSDAAGVVLENANMLASGTLTTAAQDAFDTALDAVGQLAGVSSIQDPVRISRVVGEDSSGNPLFLDTNGNGLVEGNDFDEITCESSLQAKGNYLGDLTCVAIVEPGTECQATNCPAGSTPTGTTSCFANGKMLGWTYCLEDGLDSRSVGTVAGTLEFMMITTISEQLISSAVRSSLMTVFSITDTDDVHQFEVVTALNSSFDIPLRRRLTFLNTSNISTSFAAYDVSVFYELIDQTGLSLASWTTLAADLADALSSAHMNFALDLASDGGFVASPSGGVTDSLPLTVGVDGSTLLLFDYDGNGIVNADDDVNVTTTTSTTTTTASETSAAASSSSSSSSDDDNNIVLVIIIAALGLLVLLCCCCLWPAYVTCAKAYR